MASGYSEYIQGFADVLAPLQGGQGEEFQGLLSGRTYGETNGETFTRTWALSCHGQRLWVRYTCSAGNAELEWMKYYEAFAKGHSIAVVGEH